MAFSSSSAVLKFTCVMLMMCMVVMVAPYAEAAISCGQVETDLRSCILYLGSENNRGLQECCIKINSLNNAAQTTPDRQAACRCINSAFGMIEEGLNFDLAATLPSRCGLRLPFKISPSTDCNKVS